MQKINDLRLEIFFFEDEIASLQHELAAAGGGTLKLAICIKDYYSSPYRGGRTVLVDDWHNQRVVI